MYQISRGRSSVRSRTRTRTNRPAERLPSRRRRVHFRLFQKNATLSNLAVRRGRKRLSPDAARREARHRAWTCSRTPHASSRCAARAQPRSLCSARRAVSAANVPSWCRLHRLGASEAAALAVDPPRATPARAARNTPRGRRARAPRAPGAAASGPRDRPRDAGRRVVCRRLAFTGPRGDETTKTVVKMKDESSVGRVLYVHTVYAPF